MLALVPLAAVGTATAQELTAKPAGVRKGGFVQAQDVLYLKQKNGDEGYVKVAPQATMAGMANQAAAIKKGPEDEVYLVMLDADFPQDEARRRVLFKSVLVELADGVDDKRLAAELGAVSEGRLSYAPSFCVFKTSTLDGALTLADALKGKAGVVSAEAQLALNMARYLTPNDTLFAQQWHLRNTGQNGAVSGVDVNVVNVWNNYRGAGVRILIVDDSLEHGHPDLAANVDASISYDYRDGDSNPAPSASDDAHGISVAGIAAARGNNSLGVAGVAYEATISGVRLIGGPLTDVQIANAINHSNSVVDVSNNSWGPAQSQVIAQTTAVMEQAMNNSVNGRNGRGKILVFAAGNGGPNDNVNYNNLANSIYTIAVAALNDQGVRASYSTPGAALIVAAPSGRDATRPQGSTTTDVSGTAGYNPQIFTGDLSDRNYTQFFNGTSSASPVVSGVIALMLNANTNLTWRDVQDIIVRSARRINPGDPGWAMNGGGLRFHYDYGSGMIDAQAAVTMAQTWTNLGAQITATSTLSSLALPIPDNNNTGVSVQFNIADTSLRAEHVTVHLDAVHTYRGDLDVELVSPSGMVSRLLLTRFADSGNNYSNYRLMSARHWGERAAGTWTLRVSDRQAQDTGTLSGARLTVYGSAEFPTVPGLQVTDVTVREGNVGITNANFNVRLTPAATGPVSFNFGTSNITATAGTDFLGTNGTVTIPAGTTNVVVTVPVFGEQAIEQHETFGLVISSPTGGAILADPVGIGTIQDDDLGNVLDLVITPTTNVIELVNAVISTNTGMIVRGAQLRAHNVGGLTSSGTYQLLGPTPHTYGLTLPGLVISSGHVDDYETGPDTSTTNTAAFAVAADAGQELLLDTITGGPWNHNDVTQLDIVFDVAPGSNNVTFQVVFGSEEYPEFVGSPFVDGFGIFLNGTNIAFEGGLPININHPGFTAQLGTELNGVLAPAGRAVLTFSALVPPNSTNNVLTFIVADTTDDILDTTVYVSSLAAVQPPPIPVANILDVSPVIEGTGVTNFVNFPVQLSLISSQQVSVAYLVANGRAKRGEDYVGTSGRLIFPPFVTNQVISVPIVGDSIDEPEEGFSIVIHSPSNAFVGRSQAFAVIQDDDAQNAKISVADAVVTEGDSGTVDMVFQLRLSEPSGHVITANYGTAPGTAAVGLDYLPQSGVLAFEPGETNKTFIVKVAGDSLDEPNETFFLNLSSPTFATIEDDQGVGTITDNDATPTISVADASVTEGDTGTASLVFTVTLSNPSSQSVTVGYETFDGSASTGNNDYVSNSGTLTINPGQTQATVTVVVNSDLDEEVNETLTLNLSAPVNAGAGDMQATGTISNDDGPHFSITGGRVQEGANGTTTSLVFTVSAVKMGASSITVGVQTFPGSAASGVDYVANSDSLVFSSSVTSHEFIVTVNGDDLAETNETFVARLVNTTGGTIAVSDAEGVIVDDDIVANLAVGVTLPSTNIFTGYPFTVLLTATNQGTSSATNVVIEHTLPAGIQVLSSSFSGATGTVTQAGSVIRGVVPVLTNGQSAALSLSVLASVVGLTDFAATVTSDQFDAGLTDNSVTVQKMVFEPFVLIQMNGSLLAAESLQPLNRGLDPGETVTMTFSLKNAGNISTTNLVAVLRSANGVTTSEPAKIYGAVDSGVTVGRDFVFSVQGAGGTTVSAVLDIYDVGPTATNSLGSLTFNYQLAENLSVPSTTPISIPSVGQAATYPATATISGLQGRVARVTVQINGITHGFPDDLDVLLVAPNGKGVVLMSDAGAGLDLAGVNLTFADNATVPLPDNAKINTGTYKPTNHGGADNFPSAPAGPYAVELSSFIGIVPNGDWQLYIVDDGSGDGGSITGWSLNIETTIPADPVAELVVSGIASPNPAYVGQNYTYTIAVANMGPAAATNLRLTSQLPAGVSLVNSTPTPTLVAGNELTFNLGGLAVGNTATVTIEAVSSGAGTPTNLISVVANEIDLQPSNSSAAIGVRINRVTTLAPSGVSTVGGTFTLSLSGQAGITYVIEASSDLTNWTPIFTNTTLNGVISFTDTNAASSGLRFYRALER